MIRPFGCIAILCCGAVAAQTPPLDPPADPWTEAVLYRDEWGVPHVFADNPRSLAFAFGYAQAEDHLEAMLIAYRLANGRSAEVLGWELADADRLAIRLDHAGLALRAYENADNLTRALCEGFASGVNTWMLDYPGRTPEWAEGVQPADVLALMHRYLMSQAPFDYPEAYHMRPATPSANAWAVGPELSQSGEAMLVINPHVSYDNAFQWYEAHLVTNEINVYGATLFGLPVIVQGHNGDLGWALSPNAADTADLFIEVAPEITEQHDPKSVMPQRPPARRPRVNYTESERRPMYIWTPQGFTEEYVDRRRTWRGPIVANAEGRNLSWRAAGYEDFGAIRQLYDMGLAQDLDAFRRALDRQQLPSFHVTYADRSGNIYYQYAVKTGVRPDVRARTGSLALSGGFSPVADLFLRPLPTNDGLYDWGDMLPPDAMPWMLNPDSGYLQACGSPPWLVTSPSMIDPARFPDWLSNDTDSYRAKRARRLFSLGPRSFEDMQAMMFDTVSPLAAEAVPFLLETAGERPEFVAQAHADLQVALDMLAEWNYLADPGSLAMTYFHVWWTILRLDETGQPRANEIMHRLIMEGAPWFREHALQAAAEAALLLRTEYQSLNVPWGEVHVIQRGERVEPIGGAESGEPLFATGDRLFGDGRWYANGGFGFAMAVSFGDWPRAVSLVPFGSSENPQSRHYDDQLDLMLGRRFKRTRFHRDDIERHAESATGRFLLLRPQHQEGTVYLSADTVMQGRLGESWMTPAPLPPGMTAFTSYVEPVVEWIPPGLQIEIDLAVSPEVCATENFESLYLYSYRPVNGWREVEDQAIDPARYTLTARLDGPRVIAVLGPESFRLADPATVAKPQTLPAPRSPAASVLGETAEIDSPETNEVTAIARNDDAGVTTISPSDTERIASLRAPGPPVLVPHDGAVGMNEAPPPPPNLRRGRFPMAVPAVPPGFRPDPRTVVPPSGSVENSPRALSPLDAQSSTALPDFEPPAPPESQGDPISAPEITSQPLEPTGTPPTADGPETTSAAVAETSPAASDTAVEADRSRVSFSDKTPRELLAEVGVTQRGFELAPEPSRASQVGLGPQSELRTPDGRGVFTVRAKQPIRAQAYLSDSLPGPLPPGLRQYSPAYVVLADPPHVQANTAVVLHAAPGSIDLANTSGIQLYVFDTAEGWIPLPGNRVNAAAGSFSGIDFSVRTYAILGPAE